jgi:ribosomal protein S18 acetylase RimI-like enzyme
VSAGTIALRPAADADRQFLGRVYASTREEELARVPFTPEQRDAFLAQQFHAQSAHYAAHYPDASFDVVLVGGEPAGRLIVDRGDDAVHIVDVALLPAVRGRGAGTRLLTGVIAEAEDRGLPTRIYVEHGNPARRLYERLGFEPVSEHGLHLLLSRPPAAAQPKTAS